MISLKGTNKKESIELTFKGDDVEVQYNIGEGFKLSLSGYLWIYLDGISKVIFLNPKELDEFKEVFVEYFKTKYLEDAETTIQKLKQGDENDK